MPWQRAFAKKILCPERCRISIRHKTKVSCHDRCTSSNYSTVSHTCLKTLLISIDEDDDHVEEEEDEEEEDHEEEEEEDEDNEDEEIYE